MALSPNKIKGNYFNNYKNYLYFFIFFQLGI